MRDKRRILLAAGGAALLLATGGAHAQTQQQAFPSKPIRIIVPLAPGGSADVLARAVGQQLAEALGQPVIIDNKPGGNNILGTDALARATPDGHTLGLLISTHAINPHVNKALPYDSLKDFAPVAMVALMPGLLTVHPGVPARNVQELVALAKAKPGALAYGQAGQLSSGHLSMELLKQVAGVDIVSVPYKGGSAALSDAAAGNIQVLINSPVSAMPFVNAGRLRALATTGARRPAAFAQLPTLAESGYPGFDLNEWYGLFAPARTPRAVVERINTEVRRIMASPAMVKRLAEIGAESPAMDTARFADFVTGETARWGEVVRKVGVKLE